MVNKRINYNKNNKIIVLYSITIILISVFIGIFLINKVKAADINNGRNAFYTDIFNYSMPVVKITSSSEGNIYKEDISFKNIILSCIGFNIGDATDILKKEVTFLNSESSTVANQESDTPEDFKLNNKDVTENTVNENGDTQNSTAIIVDPKLKKTLDPSKPEILIYHSHTTESYKPSAADNLDPTKNVCAVGDELAKQLQDNYGIAVIHDKTIHNVECYKNSYFRSAETVQKYLKQYGDFKMVIDIHRDSLSDKNSTTVKLNGENVARFMFVMSKDNNPHYSKNIALVNSLINIANKDFKGLLCDKNILIYNHGINSFNQFASNNAFLIEVGCDQNDLSEAKATAKYLARIFAEQLNGKN